MKTKENVTKYGWQLLNLYTQYKDETGAEVVNLDDAYEWAAAKGLYIAPPTTPSAKFKRDLSRAVPLCIILTLRIERCELTSPSSKGLDRKL